ncbi:hypothetical protein [Petrocella atlantisensis]|nr:hypothetical protein [Petrocella atlantisensis]
MNDRFPVTILIFEKEIILKKVYVKKIDVATIAKPLFLILALLSLVFGLFMSLFMLPSSTTETLSSDGVLVSQVTSQVPGYWGSVIGMMAGIFISVMGIYIAILVGIVLFNLFCSFTGGIGIEIETKE